MLRMTKWVCGMAAAMWSERGQRGNKEIAERSQREQRKDMRVVATHQTHTALPTMRVYFYLPASWWGR